jgi:hypothetical protein
MSPLRLNGTTSGFTEIDAPAVAGSNTLTLPGGNGTNGQVLTTDGAGALSFTTVAGAGSLADGSAAAPSVAFASDVNTGIFRAGNDLLAFSTGGTQRAQFDASGRLLIGTSTAPSTGSLQYSKLLLAGNTVNNGGSQIALTRGQAFNGLGSGQDLGYVYFGTYDGGNYGAISCFSDGASTATSTPGRLAFSTTAAGASSPTPRLTIASTGQFFTYSAIGDAFDIGQGSTAGTTNSIIVGRYGSTNNNPSGTVSIRIYNNGNIQNTNNSYGALSDIKLKENIVDATSQWSDIKALQVRKYNFKEGQTHTQIGLVAQEAELVSPGLVSESPDREHVEVPLLDADGNPVLDDEGNPQTTTEERDLGTVTKSVNYSVLYMKAVKALQEAMERIESLEARLTALEVTP